jgi:hypothetical protein
VERFQQVPAAPQYGVRRPPQCPHSTHCGR